MYATIGATFAGERSGGASAESAEPARRRSSGTVSVMRVAAPGEIALARMSGAHSVDWPLVRPMSPALDAA